jgi:hypothetical protein
MNKHKYKVGDIVKIHRAKVPEQCGGHSEEMIKYRGLTCEIVDTSASDDMDKLGYRLQHRDETEVNNYVWDERCLRSVEQTETKKTAARYRVLYKRGVRYHAELVYKTCDNEERKRAIKAYLNCILPDHAQRAIDEAIMITLNAHLFDVWGLSEHFEKGVGNTILLYGMPGVGKTMIAEGLAAVLDKPLMVLTNAELQSSVPGQMERNIADAFKTAKGNNAVVVFDECDSLLYDRNAVGAIMAAEINFLLSCIERYNGIVILTTNRLHKLDGALERRILCKVEVPAPDVKARLAIWKALTPPKLPCISIDYNALAELPLTGGQIKNAVIKAARRAIATGKKQVTHDDMFISAQSEIVAHNAFDHAKDKPVIFG